MSNIKNLKENFLEFIRESLAIERIFRNPTDEEFPESWRFLNLEKVTIADLVQYVQVFQPEATLRDNDQKRVWIGGKEASKGGEALLGYLTGLLTSCQNLNFEAASVHQEYEFLHPFTDGNGRSGTILWANLMFKQGYKFEYRFLQMYYYQTLSKASKEYQEEYYGGFN